LNLTYRHRRPPSLPNLPNHPRLRGSAFGIPDPVRAPELGPVGSRLHTDIHEAFAESVFGRTHALASLRKFRSISSCCSNCLDAVAPTHPRPTHIPCCGFGRGRPS
jgi:hypothetical protein